MKKAIIVFLFAALLINLAIFPSYAFETLSTEVPYAQMPPVIDGVFNADEWQNAWHYLLDAQDPPMIVTGSSLAEEYYPTYDFYTMWDEENFYFAVVCKGDISLTPKKMESGMDTRDNSIRGDGIQLYMNPTGDYAQTEGKDAADATYGASYVWTDFYCEYADNVTPFTWAYSPFDGDIIDAMPAVYDGFVIDSSRNGDTWMIEVKAPWLVLNGTASGGNDQWNMTYPRKAGDKVIYNFNTLDYEGENAGQVRYGMTEDGARVDGSTETWKQFTLVSTPAGLAPAPDPEPELEPEVEVDSAVANGGDEDVHVSPVAAPITGDASALFAILAIITGILIAAIRSAKKQHG